MIKKFILTASLLGSSFTNAQSFTNTVNTTTDSSVFNYVEGPASQLATVEINKPLYFFMSFVGPSGEVSGELKHLGEEYTLFSEKTLSGTKVVVGPIDDFFGKSRAGNWQFKVESSNPFFVESWGITEMTIPEPSVASLVVLGTSILWFIKKKTQ